MPHNIDDPNHSHYLAPDLPAGTVLSAHDKHFQNGMNLHQSGHLTFKAVSTKRTAENPDGSVVDLVTVERTYTPNPKK